MNTKMPSEEESHFERSRFVRGIVQTPTTSVSTDILKTESPPRIIVQFWDDLDRLPDDVELCIRSWNKFENDGFNRLLFDKHQARQFIFENLGKRHSDAFDKCYHPAMQSDYFRLCFIAIRGGCYIDIDDVYNGGSFAEHFNDGRLKLQPLCYDISTHTMIPPSLFTKPGAESFGWIFYFNNNPLIAGRRNPLIERALKHATLSLEQDLASGLPEIQSTTGPGNLTKAIFDAITENIELRQTLFVLHEWESTAKNIWDLSYRNDHRNWRLSNCKIYRK